MRIAHLSFAFGEYAIRLSAALAETNDVGLWVPGQLADPYLNQLGDKVDFRPFQKPRMRQPIRQVPTMLRLYRDISQYEPDVIHLQQGYLWFNPLLPFFGDSPVVVTVHDPTPHLGDRNGRKTPQFMADMAYRRATEVIVHTEQMKQATAARGVAAERIHVVPHQTLGAEDWSTPRDHEERRVLFFGRIWPYKGLEYLIKAEPLINAEVPGTRIVIAGTGEQLTRYRAMMTHPECFEIINEFVPAHRAAELFREASVIALPYVDATQSGVIPMAYNYAKPVVATTVGGLPSQVEDGETGYLVPPRDERALADAIIRLLRNPALRLRMGVRARAKADTEYSARAVAAKTIDVYRIAASMRPEETHERTEGPI